MEYKFNEIEPKWQQHWKDTKTYKVSNSSDKPKYYVLDMFPYPSGAGLHVGHPLGYIASDIYSRYKRLKGFNVLHPMGFDSFGLPAEQYAIETGQHPAETTKKNIATFKSQLDKIGFCYDWEREVWTSNPSYYKWTQWIFLQLFNSYYDRKENKAKPIAELIKRFETEGNTDNRRQTTDNRFTAGEWKGFDEKKQQDILMNCRLAYCGYGEVNWCEALGTVLANDEVVNGVSERGGHPVVKKKLRQWYLRITEYADRLLEGLNQIEFSDAMKDMQTNWIGKSSGAEIDFEIKPDSSLSLTPNPSPSGEGSKEPSALSGHFFKPADRHNWAILKDMSRENRKNKTEAEDILWRWVRNNQLGYKVRRQHVINGFIIDYAFLNQKVLVEVDGGYHNDEEQKKYDEARAAFLTESGYTILRFTNEETTTDILKVTGAIKKILDEKETAKAASAPLSERRGAGGEAKLKVYTTRPDTIFGVDFMVVAPELELISEIKSADQATAVDEYIAYVKSRSDVERMAEKKITGCFTGAYAINPFDGKEIPIWISEYVLAGYGTGAIMAVPCGDERDFKFAQHFNIPITNIIGSYFNGEEANPTKEAVLENSGFLNGLVMKDAMEVAINKLTELGIGAKKVNYRMRDAAFSRQRYWGEPFPITWTKDGIAREWKGDLPLELPHVETYSPGPDAQGPLANIPEWVEQELETNTMPGYAGSSWYFLRYMDPNNNETFCDRKASDYWNQVDIYIGGTEHAVGHLLYSRMWTKALYDLGFIGFDEPFKKLVNQGMIQGSSRLAIRYALLLEEETKKEFRELNLFVSLGTFSKFFNNQSFDEHREKIQKDYLSKIFPNAKYLVDSITPSTLHVNVEYVDGVELNIEKFRKWKPDFNDAILICEDDSINLPYQNNSINHSKFICDTTVEKMSKRYFNTVDPADLCEKYGADTFRMYEMFLGPVEQSKPWDTKGIEGVHRFLRKLWRLFFDEIKGKVWNTDKANDAELKVLHKTIRKIDDDTERFSFNTAVSTFMICVNDLADLKCHKKEILEQVLILLMPYAPHIAEELWNQLGNGGTILDAAYPIFESKYTVESSKEYPISINGKVRANINMDLSLEQSDVEKLVLQNETVQKWLEGKAPKKIIYVKNKMVNVVI